MINLADHLLTDAVYRPDGSRSAVTMLFEGSITGILAARCELRYRGRNSLTMHVVVYIPGYSNATTGQIGYAMSYDMSLN